jgi:hypothetical protein
MSAVKKIAFRCLSVVFGLLLAALVAEMVLRLGGYSPIYVNPLGAFHEPHTLVGYRGKPNFRGRFSRDDFDVMIAHDENGFRKQEYQNPKEKTHRNIFVFGDSITWGWGVGQGKVFTDVMSRLMPHYHIMNFGLNASGTVAQFTLFEAHSRELVQPGDTVVLVFVNNDFKDNVTGFLHGRVRDGRVKRVGPTRLLRSRKRFDIVQASYLINYLVFAQQVTKGVVQEKRADQKAPQLVALGEKSPEMVVTKYFLAEFKRNVEQKRARFVVVYVPAQGELAETPNISDTAVKNQSGLRKAFFACAEPSSLRTLDLLPHFLAAKRSGQYERLTFLHDKHWNENGHAVAGKTVAEFILAADRIHKN